jgi:hypothetical protein
LYIQVRVKKKSLPANAIQIWSSSIQILRTVLASCNFNTDFFSTPRTTTFFPRTPTYIEWVNKQFCNNMWEKETYGTGTLSDSLRGIFNLKQMTIGWKHGQSTIVSRHDCLYYM